MSQQPVGLNPTNLCAIVVTLHVANSQALYIMLASDGAISRMGSGSESNTELDLFIGKVSEGVFAHFSQQITPGLFQWLGRFESPQSQGKLCQLSLAFRRIDGTELVSQWQYGTDSQGPPSEVCDFVRAAIYVTQSWYETQQKLASVM